jgi:hypothetical protein
MVCYFLPKFMTIRSSIHQSGLGNLFEVFPTLPWLAGLKAVDAARNTGDSVHLWFTRGRKLWSQDFLTMDSCPNEVYSAWRLLGQGASPRDAREHMHPLIAPMVVGFFLGSNDDAGLSPTDLFSSST